MILKLRTARTLVRSVSILFGVVSGIWVFPLPAHSQDNQTQQIQQLQDKLGQMEQQMQDLRDQINALQSASQKPAQTAALVAPATSAVTTTTQATPSAPQTQKPLDIHQPPNDSEYVQAEYTPVPPGTFSAYGFSQLDGGYNFGQINPDWYDTMRPTQLDTYKNEYAPSGTVFFSVRQTRFGVKTSSPTAFGDLKTIFEFELFGTGVDAGQTTFRLRHAWGQIGQFGGGQTWSVFMDPDVFPNSLEYWGPNGMVFFRNIQFRWMPITRGDSHLWIAAERPGASADGGVYSDRIEEANIQPKFDLPDFSVQGRLAKNWGYLQVAAIFRKISWVQTTPTPPINLSQNVFGWGVNVSSNLKLSKQDVLKAQVIYGEGVENYMNDAPIDIGVATNPSNPLMPIKGVPLPVLGTVTFLDHNWSEKFQSTIGYSFVNIDNSNAQLPSDFHQGDYALTNLTYYPVKNVMFGGEFQYGRRVNFRDGFNVNDYKIQFSAKFSYSRIVPY
jgi:hypothetical protein